MINKKITLLLLLAITILGLFLRLYKISDYPIHLGHDEISQLYDAISIKETGRDIYGIKYPFIFKSVGDYKPPFYTYATAVSYAIFGWRDISIKIPGLLFGSLMIPAVFFFVSSLLKDRRIALAASFFTAIAPFEIFFSRKSFENQAGIVFVLLGFGLLLRETKNKYETISIYVGLLLIAMSMYTHFYHVIVVPVLLIVYLIIYRKTIKKHLIKGIIIFAIALTPLFYLIYTNPEALNRTRAVSIYQDVRIEEKISSYKIQSDILEGVVKQGVVLLYAVEKLSDHLSPSYLFLNGLDLTRRDHVDVGVLYPYQIILLAIGFYVLIKSKKHKKQKWLLLIWLLIALSPSALTFEDRSPHRSIFAYTILSIISAIGLVLLLKYINSINSLRKAKIPIIGIFMCISIYFILYFWSIYQVDYSYEKSEYLHYPLKSVALYTWDVYDKYDEIVIDPKFGEEYPWIGTGTHYYLSYYGKYPPQKMQEEYKTGDQEYRETYFDKFRIRSVNWGNDSKLENSLVIASPWSLPPIETIDQDKIINTFYFFSGKPAYYALEP